jgi:carbon storage regulator
MLVLTRKKFQSLTIGDNIKITITKIKGGQARIAIDAPKEIKVLRCELNKEVAK